MENPNPSGITPRAPCADLLRATPSLHRSAPRYPKLSAHLPLSSAKPKNTVFAKTVHFKHLLLGFQCVALMAVLLTAMFVGTNNLFTPVAVALNALTLVVSIVSTAAITGPASRVHFLAIIIYYEFFVTPIFDLLLFPDNFFYHYSNINLPPIRASDINTTSLALLIGMAAMCTGIHLGAAGQQRRESPRLSKSPILAFSPMLLVCGFVLICDIAANIFWGVGRAWTVVAVDHHILQLYYLFVDTGAAMIMATVALTVNWRNWPNSTRLIGSFVIFCLWTIRVLQGTRAGLLFGAYILFIMFLFGSSALKFRRSRLVAAMACFVVLAPISYVGGSAARSITFHQELNSQVVTPGEWAHLIIKNPEGERVESNIVREMLARVNGLDSTVLLIHGVVEGVRLPMSSVAKSTINMLVPGHVWPDVLASAREFGVLYGTETANHAAEHYHTDIWYLFGMWYGVFGLPLGALGIALSMMCFTQLYRKLIEPKVAMYFGMTYPYLIALYGVGLYYYLSSQGFDAWISLMVYFIVHGALYLGAAVFLSRFYKTRLDESQSRK